MSTKKADSSKPDSIKPAWQSGSESRWQLVAAAILLAIWMLFLAWMALE